MFDWTGLIQIIFADIILSGDNALVIGMVAAGIAPEKRRMVLYGISRIFPHHFCSWCYLHH
jgi:predicted tellurium resistance membrane protein TerC